MTLLRCHASCPQLSTSARQRASNGLHRYALHRIQFIRRCWRKHAFTTLGNPFWPLYCLSSLAVSTLLWPGAWLSRESHVLPLIYRSSVWCSPSVSSHHRQVYLIGFASLPDDLQYCHCCPVLHLQFHACWQPDSSAFSAPCGESTKLVAASFSAWWRSTPHLFLVVYIGQVSCKPNIHKQELERVHS